MSEDINNYCNGCVQYNKKCLDCVIKDDCRNVVYTSYRASVADNTLKFRRNDINATSEYVYENQRIDAMNITDICFKYNQIRVVVVKKKTKVGANGLMIEIAKNISTHPDNDFVLSHENIKFITGMSNKGWEDEFKNSIPKCFEKNIFHHGQLKKLDLRGINNSLIFIDEIDCGDGINQTLDKILSENNLFDIQYLINNNIRLIFISATCSIELKNIKDRLPIENYKEYNMTIPEQYFGHTDMLHMDLIQEFFPINSMENAYKWIDEDVIENYAEDYRVHITRVNNKSVKFIKKACETRHVEFRNHTSEDRLTYTDQENIFTIRNNHCVIAIKGLWRRANLIPNKYKLRIGATMELHCKKVDTNVQIQGLPGRLSGYWKNDIINGHKTGPHRTSIQSIIEYEKWHTGNSPDVTTRTNKRMTTKLNNDLHTKHDGKQIPLKFTIINDIPELTEIMNKKTRYQPDKRDFMDIVNRSIINNDIIVEDNNRVQIILSEFTLDGFRCYIKNKSEGKEKNFRFKNYLEHFTSKKSYTNGKLSPNTCGVVCSVDLYELKDNDDNVIFTHNTNVFYMDFMK